MRRVVLVLFAILCTVSLAAQTVDGRIGSGEYSVRAQSGAMEIWAAERDGSLFLACSAPTEGWVSLGVGSTVMDGARIFIGYVDGGETAFRSDLGRGHSHREDQVAEVLAYALREEGGTTWLEIELAKDSIPFGNPLELLVGYGDRDNFRAYHRYRNAVRLRL